MDPALTQASSGAIRCWSTDEVDARQRLDYWIGAICKGFLEMGASSSVGMQFETELVSAQLGPIGVNRTRASAQDVYRGRQAILRSHDNFFYLRCTLDEEWSAVQDGRTARLLPGDLVLVDSLRCYEFLGAAVVIVGDMNPLRLQHAKSIGFEIADLSTDIPLADQIADILGVLEVDSAIAAVGSEAKGRGHEGAQHESPATVLNSLMEITRAAGKIGIPGLYVTEDPGGVDKTGSLSIRLGLGCAKSHSFMTGQTPVMQYNRALMQAILWGRIKIADIVGVELISPAGAPAGYAQFDAGAPTQFVINPHNQFLK